jgi:hypothetical protein
VQLDYLIKAASVVAALVAALVAARAKVVSVLVVLAIDMIACQTYDYPVA